LYLLEQNKRFITDKMEKYAENINNIFKKLTTEEKLQVKKILKRFKGTCNMFYKINI